MLAVGWLLERTSECFGEVGIGRQAAYAYTLPLVTPTSLAEPSLLNEPNPKNDISSRAGESLSQEMSQTLSA